ncbi:MAG: histidinol-phosphate transaminase [Kiritimatiellae bacterium]|jgi:histidinol-phosphate aminotransferase|nr:histidinol-phosphate transaminase [Kiritimatiellia bacterium]NLD89917.1 histidinol-phosphate transaminase [Lentisphaerota bacterium]HPC20015.1 histidinol-phosphate transaminase [Kiritimatiellia bacterium]HQN80785.1 histidinol-phosphate transaminase [Kiritimatiellia bacterium]HQQ61320.1 histidinol-phosphate transaminase [Kiritimatiellia bacterium]
MSLFAPLANSWIAAQRPYQPGRPLEEVARELGLQSIDGIVKLASNENNLGPSPKAMAAMQAAIPRMHLYPDGGSYYLRRAIAKKFGIGEDMVMLGCGSNEHIVLLAHAFMKEGDDLVCSEKTFVVYKLVAALYRCRCIEAPMQGMTHDLDAMLSAITPQTKLVIVANPNNPTGTLVDQAAVDRFVERVPDHVVTVFDEAYMELLEPEVAVDTVKHARAGKKPVITLRTFSKAYGLAGLRVGYAMAQPDAIDLLNKVRQPFNVTTMAQAAALAALEDEDYLVASRQMLREGRAQMMTGMRKLGLDPVESVTNFILFPFAKAAELTAALTKRKVIVRPMAGFGLPQHVRVSVGLAAENEQFLKALAEALPELQ